jgi:predicted CXXCH cytochrome family protein
MVTIRKFWETAEFTSLVNRVKDDRTERLVLIVRGWKDSSYTTPYDDPNADDRALYKLQLHLIPGVNSIYFSLGGKVNDPLEYRTRLVNESKPLEEREARFHNSELEKVCTTCHEGLPSADSGKSMKADCTVCHKAIGTASLVHAPVEMKQCVTCHSWSPGKNSMVVTKGIPNTCFDCHDEKKAMIDSAKVQHPVASECITCHSPHGSNEAAHLLKENVYDLCIGCHDDKSLNHPVGRHPVRFAKTKTGAEISCVSCHNPHGSDNEHLLTVGGNPMMVCTQCH